MHIHGSPQEHNSDKEDSISSVIHPRLLPLCQDKREEGGTRGVGGEVGADSGNKRAAAGEMRNGRFSHEKENNRNIVSFSMTSLNCV